ncbi:hypothetical protein FHS14_001926 [Paenibacillus baekrokdamisoli]|nr:hypothetical protein [Paenibacillus baekrokdamisoli]
MQIIWKGMLPEWDELVEHEMTDGFESAVT